MPAIAETRMAERSLGQAGARFRTTSSPSPTTINPDTLANLGPLRRLAGVWEGRKGVDRAPPRPTVGAARVLRAHRDAADRSAGQRPAALLRPALPYPRQHDRRETRPSDQIGYWLWEPATGLILQSLTIPRGQTALAAGHAAADATELKVAATRGGTEYGICSDHLPRAGLPARTLYADRHLQQRRYVELRLRHDPDGEGPGRAVHPPRPHTLVKVAEPNLNPWLRINPRREKAVGRQPLI